MTRSFGLAAEDFLFFFFCFDVASVPFYSLLKLIGGEHCLECTLKGGGSRG